MSNCVGSLVAACCLFATVACFYDYELDLYLDDSYNRTIQAVSAILWKSFETEIRNQSNALIFTIPSAIDINFINEVSDKEMQERIMRSLPLYESFHKDLGTTTNIMTSNEMHFKTIFYGELEEMNKRMLVGHAFSKLSKTNDRFELIVNNREDPVTKFYKLYLAVMERGMGVTCNVRYCAYPTIFVENAPFAILTLSSWNIISVDGFTWTEQSEFTLSDTSLVQAISARGYGSYEYAEFKYPKLNGCIGRVLRLPYKFNLNLTFVIPSAETMCRSPEDLWKNVQNVSLNGLQYRRRTMYVSIPLFNVSADIDLRMKLKGTVLANAFDQPSSRLYNALAFQAAEVVFNPQVPKNTKRPNMDLSQNSEFRAERPFFFALLHKISPTPIFAGLINNPGCISQCQGLYILRE